MINGDLYAWLVTVESYLDLPARRVEKIVSELRSHLCADFSDRLEAGLSEQEAAQQTLAEVGDAEAVAGGLNEVHRVEGSRLRTVLGYMIVVFGFYGIILAETGGVTQIVSRIARVTGRWEWYSLPDLASRWFAPPVRIGYLAAIVLSAIGVAFLAGYVARRGGWALGLAPYAPFMVFSVLEVAMRQHRYPIGIELHLLVTPILMGAMLAMGGHLGTELARWRSPYRRPLFAAVAGTAGIVPVLGYVGCLEPLQSPSASVIALGVLAAVYIANLVALVAVPVARLSGHRDVTA
jgi:hypothetical protein